MIYQVRANLFFTDEDEARDFYHDCILASLKTAIINPGSENTEFSLIERINNFHDANPNTPCQLVESHASL